MRNMLGPHDKVRAFLAEFVGTFALIVTGCGSAVLSAAGRDAFAGLLQTSLTFGLAMMAIVYAFGPISGGHFNPAVTLGHVIAGRFDCKLLPAYWTAQCAGATSGSFVLYIIASGQDAFVAGAFASNGYDLGSPGGFDWVAVAVCEIVLTALFLSVSIAAAVTQAPASSSALVLGFSYTLLHLVSIPVSNASFNPARSTATAFFADSALPLTQLWLFWCAPLLGATLGGLVWDILLRPKQPESNSTASGVP
ncbi:aquaporin [Ensifer sp. SL37]|uniref:aquaporin n=1 Tax=Ensifer sp. SL37 TaxID=2995137 RepID=UPI0022763433|nr:aquaporin [Ensifer sp. SL37]MCY1740864.1 aquaporin [Ensifer sp. SL37]